MAIRRTLAEFSDDIATADIAADAIDGTKLADNAVDSEHYTDASIDTAHLASNIAISTTGAITTTGAFTSIGIDDNSNALAMTIDASEDVGIGINDPSLYHASSNDLVVGGTSGAHGITIVAEAGQGSYLTFADGTTTAAEMQGAIAFNHANNQMLFGTNASVDWKMAIDSSGNVGIGTTAPGYKLHVAENRNTNYAAWIENANATTPYGLRIHIAGSTNDDHGSTYLHITDEATTRMQVYADGDVETHDSGTLTSDERLKHNIVDATPKLDDLLKLKVRNFEWNEDYHPGKVGKKMLGLIAQEVEEVFPALIYETDIVAPPLYKADEDGNDITPEHTPIIRKTIKQAFTPMIIKAIQELSAKNDALETQVSTMWAVEQDSSSNNAALEARIIALEAA